MPRFRYSLNASTIRPVPILDKIRFASQAGYEGIELWHDDIGQHLHGGGSFDDIRRALDDAGLVVPTTIYLKGWWNPSAADYAPSMQEVDRRLQQAAALGAVNVIASPPPWSDVDYPLLAREYAALISRGLAVGVRPAFEYLGFAPEVNCIAKALRVVRESAHPQAAIVIDPFHDFRGGAGHADIAQLRADQIAISHFNDAPASLPAHEQHDADRVLPGEGCLDLARYVALLRQVGYSGFVSLELFNEELWRQDPHDVVQRGLERMRAICEA